MIYNEQQPRRRPRPRPRPHPSRTLRPMISTPEHDFDAIVIGGGPAGCAAATVLAKKGRRVAVLEKQPRRRYSVGESLIPFCYDALERMGTKVEAVALWYVRTGATVMW